ncbi:MAG: hypothetical protein WDW38_007613 [Sanguina aurantia]
MAESYPLIRVLQQGDLVAVQPLSNSASSDTLETLSVDLQTGTVTLLQQPPITATGIISALGLLGLAKLQTGYALVLATAAAHAAHLSGARVYTLETHTVLQPQGSVSSDNQSLLTLLADALDPLGSGRTLYFSHFHDLTRSEQEARPVGGDVRGPGRGGLQPDPRYFWNRAIARPLLDAGADRFVLPLIMGFVRQLPGLTFTSVADGKTVSATLTLIARRSAQRAGTRHWRRGADPEGNAANFVETEQILSLDDSSSSGRQLTLASYVEVRGSIPLLWTQLPSIKYKPTTVIAPAGDSSAPFDKHFKSLEEQYQDVVAVNLINHKGTEGRLEEVFRKEALRYASSVGPLRYLAFDFHHETKGQRYARVSLLWDKVEEDFLRHGFSLWRQGGVLGRKALEHMLVRLGLLAEKTLLAVACVEVERQFKILWADHGDAVSTQYAGTGAMKSGFTRTGKRTVGGMIDDGVKAVLRYYLNNFQDGKKQDAVDLLTGAFTPDGRPLPLKSQPSPLLPILFALLAIAFGSHSLGRLISEAATSGFSLSSLGSIQAGMGSLMNETTANGVKAVLLAVLLPLTVGFGLLALVVQNGKHLVNKPQLCPQLANTVRKVAGGGKAKSS